MASSAVSRFVLNGEFPLTAQFRSGPRNVKPTYELWEEEQPRFDGNPVDIQSNVLRFAPANYKYANKYAADNPNTLILSTWRAASGTPLGAKDDGDPLGESPITFPGHFVLSPGAYLDDAASSSTTKLIVKSDKSENMLKGPALLVNTKNNGKSKVWSEFEYVLITGVSGEKVSVKREFNGSPAARSFPAGSYIAPMPWDNRNRKKYIDWFFNFSKDCPTDKQGRTAMDVIFEQMVAPLKSGRELSNIGGLDLASGPLTVTPDNADYNIDGEVDPDSVYRDGVRNFYRRIRNVLGPDRVLTTSLDYRNVDYINGVNLEGLARPDDAWNEVSRTVNKVLAWKTMNILPMISLAFVQYVKSEDQDQIVQLHRLLNGYATCLGLAADADDGDLPDSLNELTRIELFKGDANEAHWLGKAVSMTRPAARTPNLLNNAKSNTDWRQMLEVLSVGNRADMSIDNNELLIEPYENIPGYVTLVLSFSTPQKGDFTVYFDAKSEDDQLERDILLPRVSGVSYETGPVRASMSSLEYFPLSFYVRGASKGNVKMDFRFADGGAVRIKNLSVHAAPDTLACEYENGIVLVNPSLDDTELDLTEIFPNREGFRRIAATRPSGDVPSRYNRQLNQALEMNNGRSVGNPRSVEIGQRNSLFLITTDTVSAPSGGSGNNGGNNNAGGGGSSGSNDSPPPSNIFDNEEDTTFFYKGRDLSCGWAGKLPDKLNKRCSKDTDTGPKVREFCPKTCRG